MRHHALSHSQLGRRPRPVVSLAAPVKTFGSLLVWLALILLFTGGYILQQDLSNPLNADSSSLLFAAFFLAIAAILLFYLVYRRRTPWHNTMQRMRPHRHAEVRESGIAEPLLPAAAPPRQVAACETTRHCRRYVDSARIHL